MIKMKGMCPECKKIVDETEFIQERRMCIRCFEQIDCRKCEFFSGHADLCGECVDSGYSKYKPKEKLMETELTADCNICHSIEKVKQVHIAIPIILVLECGHRIRITDLNFGISQNIT